MAHFVLLPAEQFVCTMPQNATENHGAHIFISPSCLNSHQCRQLSRIEIEAITRQWMRLGLHLELSQLLGIFYSHIGFYMNQALVNRATKAKRERLDACRVI